MPSIGVLYDKIKQLFNCAHVYNYFGMQQR